ncbi:MAG: hypothetical protein RIE58_06105 [Vicingaceae bacterium]
MGKYYFVKFSQHETCRDLINGMFVMNFGGDFSNPEKKYPFDFKMYSLFDPETFKVVLLPFSNPDFDHNALRIDAATHFSFDKRLYIRYGGDNTIYKLSEDFKLEKTKYMSPEVRSINVKHTEDRIQDSINYKKYKFELINSQANIIKFSDTYYFDEGRKLIYIRFIPKSYAFRGNGILVEYRAVIDIMNQSLEIIESIELQDKDFTFPPFFSDNKLFLQKKSSDKNRLKFIRLNLE